MVAGLIVICGATATGKSGLAIQLAERLQTAILSADSRQVYRELDIGTAKPTVAEQALVPHYLVDICDPTQILTLADYQAKAQGLISTLNSPVLLVGGTGLYIKSIVRGMKIPQVAPHLELRSQLQQLGQHQCYQWLRQVDPEAANKIHPNDPVRTQRALEVFYVTGHPISEQQGENPPDYPILQIGLTTSAEGLKQRIQTRTAMMVEMGLVEEVNTLCQKYGLDLPLLATLGYAEIKQYLAGEILLPEAIELTVKHTRQFAKRQRTWFRAYPEIEWFDADSSDLLEKVWQRIQVFLDEVNQNSREYP
ncbi:MAG: tRNA (adenosine(37)-N6)-dimethylallyltransferase MiaA [Microcoleaceae cyanobacterium]